MSLVRHETFANLCSFWLHYGPHGKKYHTNSYQIIIWVHPIYPTKQLWTILKADCKRKWLTVVLFIACPQGSSSLCVFGTMKPSPSMAHSARCASVISWAFTELVKIPVHHIRYHSNAKARQTMSCKHIFPAQGSLDSSSPRQQWFITICCALYIPSLLSQLCIAL